MFTKRAGLLLAALSAVVATASACGGGDDSGDAPKVTATDEPPATTLSRAAEAIGGLKSFHFVLSHEKGSTPIAFGLSLTRAEGDVAAPDRLRADLKAERGRLNVNVKVIANGKDLWITDPIAGRWQKAGDSINIRDFLAPDQGVPELLRNARDPRADGVETIGGVRTRRIKATVESGAIRALVPIAKPGVDVPVTLWIGAGDALVRRIVIEGALSPSERAEVRRRLDLSRFDEPVDIAPP